VILAGDIGGTNARLALFEVVDWRLQRRDEARLSSRGSTSLEQLLDAFLEPRRPSLHAAGFGLPGPVKGGRVVTTNLPWLVDEARLRGHLRIGAVSLLNDIEAFSHGLPALDEADLFTLNPGEAGVPGNRAVIAAGTGLGQAGLFWDGRRHHPFATEGGHTDFAPTDELQFGLLRFLQERHGRVSWERVVSGPGLLNVHEYLRDVARVAAPAELPASLLSDDPAATLTNAALARACPLALRTVDLFLQLYGAEAGNLALKMMALGGLFVGGGIAPKLLPKLQEPTFVQAFLAKGRMRKVVEGIPVKVVLRDGTGLLGAARHAALRAGLLHD
jgi:glucokinase